MLLFNLKSENAPRFRHDREINLSMIFIKHDQLFKQLHISRFGISFFVNLAAFCLLLDGTFFLKENQNQSKYQKSYAFDVNKVLVSEFYF
jgi:hypothetical protein